MMFKTPYFCVGCSVLALIFSNNLRRRGVPISGQTCPMSEKMHKSHVPYFIYFGAEEWTHTQIIHMNHPHLQMGQNPGT